MNSDQLRQYRVIAECKNITKAAEKLYITQPALSVVLSKLEDETACQLFLREGRNLQITPEGEKLLEYANSVTNIIDEATEFFRVKEYSRYIKLYRIGGTSGPLLMEGCYNFGGYRLNSVLVRNDELPRIASSNMPDIIISDDRYIKEEQFRNLVKIPLYRQQLLLCVSKEDSLAERDEISVKELEKVSMMGRTNPIGFNNWLMEVKNDNFCSFDEEVGVDNVAYFAERDCMTLPYLLGSFGLGTERGKSYFATRKLLKVTGSYTNREIFLWYDRRNRKDLKKMVEHIIENASRIDSVDKQSSFI